MNGSQLKEELYRLKLSQKDFAEILTERAQGTVVSQATVSRWCTSVHPVPPATAFVVELLVDIQATGVDVRARYLPRGPR